MAENKYEAVNDELTEQDVKKENAALSDADMKEVSGGGDVRARNAADKVNSLLKDGAPEGSGANDWRNEGTGPLAKEVGDPLFKEVGDK